MDSLQETALPTDSRTDEHDSLGLQRLRQETKNGQNADLNNRNV